MQNSAPMFEGPAELIVFGIFLIAIIIMALLPKNKTRPPTGDDVAEKLGLKYSKGHSDHMISRFSFINRMNYGRKKFVLNTLEGRYSQQDVVVFDLRYDTCSIDKNGPADWYTFYILKLPREVPEATIYHEGYISKIKQLTGANDIDFESHEFSRTFRVRSADAQFAYDFCNARMIDYLQENTDLSIEVDQDALCLSFNKPLEFEDVERNLKRLVTIRNLMPDYVFEE